MLRVCPRPTLKANVLCVVEGDSWYANVVSCYIKIDRKLDHKLT